jgi:hypothetical protein
MGRIRPPDLRSYRVHVDEGQDPPLLEISLLPPVDGVGVRTSAITSDSGVRFDAYPGPYILAYTPARGQGR